MENYFLHMKNQSTLKSLASILTNLICSKSSTNLLDG